MGRQKYEYYYGIDLIKFICSYLVCIIHIAPFPYGVSEVTDNINHYLQNGICRVAVPFFFICSGFLCYRLLNNKQTNEKLKNYIFRLLRLLGLYTVLYFFGKGYQLWYLRSLVIVVLICFLIFRTGRIKRVFAIIPLLLYFIGLFGNSYYGMITLIKNHSLNQTISLLYDDVLTNTRNGLFFGLVFFVIGLLFAKYYFFTRINLPVSVIGFMISMSLLCLEVYLLSSAVQSRGNDMYISLLPASFFLFCIALNLRLKESASWRKLRIIGVLIFFLHLFVDYFMEIAVKLLNYILPFDAGYLLFPTTIVVTTFIAIVIERFSHTKKFGWLKYLYS